MPFVRGRVVVSADERFMRMALAEAEAALSAGEFPVGCVVVHGRTVVASGARAGSGSEQPNEVDHAEITALRRLDAVPASADRRAMTIYCTMEPCLMCYAAILLAGLGRIVYAYEDVMGGGTRCDLSALPPLYQARRAPVVSHVLRRESLALFQKFFSDPANPYWRGSLLARYTLRQDS